MKDGKNLNVPLSTELHRELKAAAARLGRSSTSLAREAIQEHVRLLQRRATDQAIQEWAEEVAGSELDLDPDLADASLEFLQAEHRA